MKIIILAAGQGVRLRPLTDTKPKCMVEYNGKSIIDYLLETIKECSIDDISIVNGYKKEVLESHLSNEKLSFYTNESYFKTNMVNTLFCAKEAMNDDVIISYSDIIYKKEVLEKLLKSNEDFSVVIDKKWKELWEQRMENPLNDAETLKIKNGNIVELGKKPKSYDEIAGQYIGLIKISKAAINKIISFYESLDKAAMYDGKDFDNMYMTSFIQNIIDKLLNVKPVYIEGGWLEIDSLEDLQSYPV
jgi:L-glutamine-phosphate cytidylyltransferase